MQNKNSQLRQNQSSRSWLKWLVLGILVLVFAGGMVFSFSRSASQYKELPSQTGSQATITGLAPDIELYDLSGKKVRLSDFRGKAVLLNFWSVSCPACLIELRSLESLAQQLSGKPFALLAITSDSRRVIKEFLQKTELKLPVYFDTTGEAYLRYGVMFLPTSFVIDPQGRLVDKVFGAADWSAPSVISYFQKLFEESQFKESEQSQQKALE